MPSPGVPGCRPHSLRPSPAPFTPAPRTQRAVPRLPRRCQARLQPLRALSHTHQAAAARVRHMVRAGGSGSGPGAAGAAEGKGSGSRFRALRSARPAPPETALPAPRFRARRPKGREGLEGAPQGLGDPERGLGGWWVCHIWIRDP